jgi:hypothetical protein
MERGNGDKLLRVTWVAKRLGKAPRTVWRMIKDGQLPSVKQDVLRVPESALADVASAREK